MSTSQMGTVLAGIWLSILGLPRNVVSRKPILNRRYSLHSNDNFSEATSSLITHEVKAEMKVSFFAQIDLTNVEKIRDACAERGLKKPSYTAFVTHAVSAAIKETPQLNIRTYRPFWRPFGRKLVQQFHNVDITIQAEREIEGAQTATFADTIRDANHMSLSELQVWLEALRDSTLENNEQWSQYHWLISRLPGWLSRHLISLPLHSADAWSRYRGSAVLINSPARYGVDFIVGCWPWPLTVSFGLVKPRPIAREGRVIAAPTFNLILSFDRTLVAGAQAARFFKLISDKLEHFKIPEQSRASHSND